jgi:hypothetical protein
MKKMKKCTVLAIVACSIINFTIVIDNSRGIIYIKRDITTGTLGNICNHNIFIVKATGLFDKGWQSYKTFVVGSFCDCN